MELEEAIKKLKKPKNIDLITLIRQFKREGIENFVVTRPDIIETVLNHLTKQKKMIESLIKHICDIIDNDDNASLLPFYNSDDNIEEKVKQYFEKKAEESE